MSTPSTRGTNYAAAPVPKAYNRNWTTTELQKIQRAMPPSVVRTISFGAGGMTQALSDRRVNMDGTNGAFSFLLLAPNLWLSFELTVKKVDASHTITLLGVVDGTTNPTLTTQYQTMTIYSDGVSLWTE